MTILFMMFFLATPFIMIVLSKKNAVATKQLKRAQTVGNSRLTIDDIKKQQLFFKQNKMGWIIKAPTILSTFTALVLVAIGFVIRDSFNEPNAILYMGLIGIISAAIHFGNIFATLKSYKIRSEYVKANPDNPLKIFVEPQRFIDNYRIARTHVVITILIMSAVALVWGLMLTSKNIN